MTYDERYQEILDRYAGFEQEILAREITEEYTEEDQQLDLAENETLKNNELSALNEEYGQIIQNIIIGCFTWSWNLLTLWYYYNFIYITRCAYQL